MARSEDEVKRAKQARAAHARAVRAANKEKREKLKANRIALMARARANKAQNSRPPACDEAGSRLIDVQKAEFDPINPCIRVCTSDRAAEPPVRVGFALRRHLFLLAQNATAWHSAAHRAASRHHQRIVSSVVFSNPTCIPAMTITTAPSRCSSTSGDPDRQGGQDPPKTARSANAPNDNERDARADSPPADPAIDAKPQLCSNPEANEHSTDSDEKDDHRLLPQPAPAATEVGESQQAESSEVQRPGSSEAQQAGNTETKEAGSTETKEAGSTDAPEEDKLDWVDDACEYWGERYTSLKMRIDMLKGRKEKGRSIDENKLMYYRKINYEIQKKRKRERDIKRAALKKDSAS
ncbi:hypothetical protein CMUS01_10908 [Colletotrichum musicola]|uniref:Uncharacterized protein n=1 Tax=Colletotrichum musicola TaxID=2175873 RepID=A0A8H6N7U1_9PEZI|nr:hypothetical protein CMUS01_10908 [Colletotrichum musicola]